MFIELVGDVTQTSDELICGFERSGLKVKVAKGQIFERFCSRHTDCVDAWGFFQALCRLNHNVALYNTLISLFEQRDSKHFFIYFIASICVFEWFRVSCLFPCVTQGHLSDPGSSESGMIILEGEADVSRTSEENNFEANKKTDEMTGILCSLHIAKRK